jgi:hypothetical protein
LGGTPQISVDTLNKVVELWFQGPAPTQCILIYMPVCALEGTFGPLTAGKWTFRCLPLGVDITFTVTGTGGGGGVIYVDRNSPGPIRDGSSWTRAYRYLQDALAVPGTGHEIRVADGTYRPDQGGGKTAGDREASFEVAGDVLVRGGYAGYGAANPDARDIRTYATTLTGDLGNNDLWGILNRTDNSYHVVTVSGSAKLDGLNIVNGQADGPYPYQYGGGIYAASGHLIASRCTLRGNAGLFGGGAAVIGASAYFANCNLSGNRAYLFGGGLYNQDGATTLASCLMTGDSISGSEVGGGSAISNIGGSASSVTISNCTLADNIGPYPDDIVIFNYRLSSSMTQGVTIRNSIVYNDGGPSLIWTDDTADVVASYSLLQGGWAGAGNLSSNPLFVQRGAWSIEGEWIDSSSDYSLQSGSPAINAGNNGLIATDQADVDDDGNTAESHPRDLADENRVQNTTVDMGAYENSGSGGGSGYAWQILETFDVAIDVPYGVTAPINLSGSATKVVVSSFEAELKLEIVGTSIAGGTWSVWFDPDPGTVGPGTESVSFDIFGANVAVNLLTPGATDVKIAEVTMYARPVH